MLSGIEGNFSAQKRTLRVLKALATGLGPAAIGRPQCLSAPLQFMNHAPRSKPYIDHSDVLKLYLGFRV